MTIARLSPHSMTHTNTAVYSLPMHHMRAPSSKNKEMTNRFKLAQEAEGQPLAAVPTQHVADPPAHLPSLLASSSLGNVYALPWHGLKNVVALLAAPDAWLVGFTHTPLAASFVSPPAPHSFSVQRSALHPERKDLSPSQVHVIGTV